MPKAAEITIGDRVRIRGTPATLALELAGQVGQVRSMANPRELDTEPLGIISDKKACEVLLESGGEPIWIMAPLLTRVDPSVDGKGPK